MPSIRVEMNYLRVYCNLIRKAENRDCLEGYAENHHTFPISVYGENQRTVKLTAREHYIAHALLEKIFIKRYGEKDKRSIKMIHAFYCMNSANRKNYYNSFLYESSRVRAAKAAKGRKLSQESIELMRQSALGRKHNEKAKQKIRQKRALQVFSEETNQKRKDTIRRLCWLHHPITKKNCRVLPEKVEERLNDGFILGRYYVASQETRKKLSQKTILQWQTNPPRK